MLLWRSEINQMTEIDRKVHELRRDIRWWQIFQTLKYSFPRSIIYMKTFALTLDCFYRYIAEYKLLKIKSKFFLIVNMYCQIMQNRLIKVLYFQCVHLTCTNKNAMWTLLVRRSIPGSLMSLLAYSWSWLRASMYPCEL